jgi:hypothetical protein
MALQIYQRAALDDEKAVEPRLRIASVQHVLQRYCDARDGLLAARDLETDPGRREMILRLLNTVEPECRREKSAPRR